MRFRNSRCENSSCGPWQKLGSPFPNRLVLSCSLRRAIAWGELIMSLIPCLGWPQNLLNGVGLVEVRAIFFVAIIPSAGDVLREADRARTLETKVRVWSRSLDPIDSIGQLLSITVGRNTRVDLGDRTAQ